VRNFTLWIRALVKQMDLWFCQFTYYSNTKQY